MMCRFSFKKITKCCIARFLLLFHFLYILKNIFRNSSAVSFCGFVHFFRKFLQTSAVPGNAAHRIFAQKSSRKVIRPFRELKQQFFGSYRCSSAFAMLK